MGKYYTGIGSRETPEDILDLMELIGYKLADKGWTLRSGGAVGADQAFEEGWRRWLSEQDVNMAEPFAEIYLPWNGFSDRYHGEGAGAFIVVKDIEQARDIASVIHPAWKTLKPSVKNLHARNCYQILGSDLETPSRFVVCYAQPTPDGYVKGGTRTAVVLAKNHGIEVFNLYFPEVQKRLIQFVDKE